MKNLVMLALLVLGTSAFAKGTQAPTTTAPAKEAPAKKHHKHHHHKAKKMDEAKPAADAKK